MTQENVKRMDTTIKGFTLHMIPYTYYQVVPANILSQLAPVHHLWSKRLWSITFGVIYSPQILPVMATSRENTQCVIWFIQSSQFSTVQGG